MQINLPVTLHLNCANVDLGLITRIGRSWQSRKNASTYPSSREAACIWMDQIRLIQTHSQSWISHLPFFPPSCLFSFNTVIIIFSLIKPCVRIFFFYPRMRSEWRLLLSANEKSSSLLQHLNCTVGIRVNINNTITAHFHLQLLLLLNHWTQLKSRWASYTIITSYTAQNHPHMVICLFIFTFRQCLICKWQLEYPWMSNHQPLVKKSKMAVLSTARSKFYLSCSCQVLRR